MLPNPDEPGLLERAISGDKQAFGDLYVLHLDAIYRYIFFRVDSRSDAEDLAEQVFLRAWERLPEYRVGSAPFRAWLYRIAHNLVIDYYRKRPGPLPVSDQQPSKDKRHDPEARYLAKERAARLASAVRQLSAVHQHVLLLRFVNGLSSKEAAEVLGRTDGAVRVLQHRALDALRKLIAADEGAVDDSD